MLKEDNYGNSINFKTCLIFVLELILSVSRTLVHHSFSLSLVQKVLTQNQLACQNNSKSLKWHGNLVSTSNKYFSRSEEISLGNQRVCVTYTRKNIKKKCSGLGLISLSLLAPSCQYILQPSSICHSFFPPYFIENLLQKVQSAYCIYFLFAVYASAHYFLASSTPATGSNYSC